MLETVLPFFDDAKNQLNSTDHFGVLGELLASDKNTTRLLYVTKHCDLLLRVKQSVSGSGLGSSNGFPRVSMERDDYSSLRSWSGLAVCQAWAVLLNAGHLFGTFATERSLLFHLDRDLEDRETFVSSIVNFDLTQGNQLRSIVERAIYNANLHRFHYLLALWRLRDGGSSTLEPNLRNHARLLVKCFLSPPSDAVQRWTEIFRRTRQLTYMEIHRTLPDAKYTVAADTHKPEDLLALFPNDSLPDADWVSRSRWQVVEAIDRHDAALLFGSSEAAARVLAHIQAFKPWLAKNRRAGKKFSDLLDGLFTKPADWIEHKAHYNSFVHIRVPSRLDWLTETRLWLRDSNQNDPWNESNFLVTPNPRGGLLSIDLYSGPSGFQINTLEHCIIQLSRAFSGVHLQADNHSMWMSTARLVVQAFQACMKENYSVKIQPTHGLAGHIGYASVGESYELVRGLVKGFLASCNDVTRENELRQLLSLADRLGSWRTPTMIMLARTLVVETIENRTVAELDGLCGFFEGGSLHWIIMECKGGESSNGKKQLQDGIGTCLKETLGEIKYFKYRSYDAWYTTITSEAVLH